MSLREEGALAAPSSLARQELAWVEAARAGDRQAFAELYRRFAPTVHGIVLASARRRDADDLVQEVFLLALRGIARLGEPERFPAWLASIARNRARDAHKAARAEGELPEDLAERARRDGATGEEDAEESERALAALLDLPEAYRETLALRLVEGLSGPQIAARTGLTAGSVRVNLCRGMKLLRETLARRGR